MMIVAEVIAGAHGSAHSSWALIVGAHIVGAHIVGAHATELIHELAVARENEFAIEEIELAIHAHPTLSEANAEASLDAMWRVIHAEGLGGNAPRTPGAQYKRYRSQ